MISNALDTTKQFIQFRLYGFDDDKQKKVCMYQLWYSWFALNAFHCCWRFFSSSLLTEPEKKIAETLQMNRFYHDKWIDRYLFKKKKTNRRKERMKRKNMLDENRFTLLGVIAKVKGRFIECFSNHKYFSEYMHK